MRDCVRVRYRTPGGFSPVSGNEPARLAEPERQPGPEQGRQRVLGAQQRGEALFEPREPLRGRGARDQLRGGELVQHRLARRDDRVLRARRRTCRARSRSAPATCRPGGRLSSCAGFTPRYPNSAPITPGATWMSGRATPMEPGATAIAARGGPNPPGGAAFAPRGTLERALASAERDREHPRRTAEERAQRPEERQRPATLDHRLHLARLRSASGGRSPPPG